MKYSLAPIVNDSARVIILGSLPGDVSLQQGQYYAHPQNHFWRIVFRILGEDIPTDYAQRCDRLLAHNIALWDVIHYADRTGSLDTSIKMAVTNDFEAFFAQYPTIELAILNGDKAAKLFHKQYRGLAIKTAQVPSSSPARANLTLDEKISRWQAALSGYVQTPQKKEMPY